MNLNNHFVICIVIILITPFYYILNAQPDDKIKAQIQSIFETYTDEINCEIQKALLIPHPDLELEELNCKDCDSETLEERLTEINAGLNIEIHKYIIKDRNKGYAIVDQVNYKDVMKEYINDIFVNYDKIRDSKLGRDEENYDTYHDLKEVTIKEIRNRFVSEIEAIPKEESIPDNSPETNEKKSEGTGIETEESSSSNLIPIVLSLGSIFLLAFVAVYARRIEKQQTEFLRRINRNTQTIENLELSLSNIQDSLRGNKTRFSSVNNNDLLTLEREISILKNDVQAIYSKLEQSNTPIRKTMLQREEFETGDKRYHISQEPVISKQLFYLTDPDPSGFFWDDKKSSSFSPNQSAFELEIDPINSNSGKFSIINDESRHKALISSYDVLLEPACEIVGSKEGTKITQIKPGAVKLQGDKWNIVKKCIINIT